MNNIIRGGGANPMVELYKGDCLEVLNKLIAEGRTVQTVICDPPYG